MFAVPGKKPFKPEDEVELAATDGDAMPVPVIEAEDGIEVPLLKTGTLVVAAD